MSDFGHDEANMVIAKDDQRWLIERYKLMSKVVDAARAAVTREINEHSTDYDHAHPWTDEAEGREHLWAICQALAELDGQ